MAKGATPQLRLKKPPVKKPTAAKKYMNPAHKPGRARASQAQDVFGPGLDGNGLLDWFSEEYGGDGETATGAPAIGTPSTEAPSTTIPMMDSLDGGGAGMTLDDDLEMTHESLDMGGAGMNISSLDSDEPLTLTQTSLDGGGAGMTLDPEAEVETDKGSSEPEVEAGKGSSKSAVTAALPAPETTKDDASSDEASDTAPKTPSKITPEEVSKSSHDAAIAASEKILASKKRSGKEDSREMARLKEKLGRLLDALREEIPEDYQMFANNIFYVEVLYREVIEACQDYIAHIREKGGGKSIAGRERLNLVRSLVAQYKNEKVAFGPTARRLYRENSGLSGNWSEVLGAVRIESVDRIGSDTVGSGTSVIFKRKSDSGEEEFVKPEERTAGVTAEAVATEFLSEFGSAADYEPLITAMQKYYTRHKRKHPSEKYREFKDFLRAVVEDMAVGNVTAKSNQIIDYTPGEEARQVVGYNWAKGGPMVDAIIKDVVLKDKAFLKMFTTMHVSLSKKRNEAAVASDNAGIRYGSVVSDRNESTSRIADRLGLSSIVARSQTGIIDRGNGVLERANVMQKAKGKSMYQLLDDAKAARSKGIDVNISYTPNSLMQMFHLQILDLITGQVDRHGGNYFVDVKEESAGPKKQNWFIEGIQAIDNDLAFGEANMQTLVGNSQLHPSEFHNVSLLDPTTGKSSVTYMSKQFYERLMTYTPEMAALDLIDQRSDEELAALKDRMEQVKEIVKKEVTGGNLQLVDERDTDTLRERYMEATEKATGKAVDPFGGVPKNQLNGVIWAFVKQAGVSF